MIFIKQVALDHGGKDIISAVVLYMVSDIQYFKTMLMSTMKDIVFPKEYSFCNTEKLH